MPGLKKAAGSCLLNFSFQFLANSFFRKTSRFKHLVDDKIDKDSLRY